MSQAFYKLTPDEWLEVTKILKYADVRVLYYLRTLDPFGDKKLGLSLADIAKQCGLTKGCVSKSIRVLASKNLIDPEKYVRLSESDQVERIARDKLHAQLGGLTEVATPVGRIDLLTATEVIEVKHINDWKAALGQVLAYSGFYPLHQKRVHLFYSVKEANDFKLIAAASVCKELGVQVTSSVVASKVEEALSHD